MELRLDKLKLRHQIVLMISVSAVLLILIQLFYWLSFYTLTKDRARRYEQKIIDQTFIKIESVLKDIKTNTNLITLDKKMQEFVITDDNSKRDLVLGPFILDLMEYVKAFNSIIYSIQIEDNSGRTIDNLITSDGLIYSSKEFIELAKEYRSDTGKYNKAVFTSLVKDPNTGKEFFFYMAPIIETIGGVNFGEKMGNCTMMISTANFQELIENSELTPNSILAILDNENRIIASNKSGKQGMLFDDTSLIDRNNSNQLNITTYKGRKVIFQQRNLEQAVGWKIVSVIPINELTTDMNFMIKVGAVSLACIIIILLVLGIMVFKNITQPVTGLVHDMKKVGEGKFDFRLKVRSTNEVGILAMEINSMMDRIEEMTRKIFKNQSRMYELEITKRKAEFSALQSQINPHFLYNTLNCISSIGLAYGSKEIAEISSCMSSIFRYSIRSADLVSIQEEVECIKAFLNIIAIRYRGKYSLNMDIDEAIMDMKTPKMVLQPIVENAIYHGLENNQHGGELLIKGFLNENHDVCFSIFDSGVGIDPVKLEAINNKLKIKYEEMIKDTDTASNIGLANINKRIRLLFGEKYGIQITSTVGWGTKVLIMISAVASEE